MNILAIIFFLHLICIQKNESKKSYPVLEFRPRPKSSSTLIWYKMQNKESAREYKNDLEKLLKPYLTTNKTLNSVYCDQNQAPPKDKFCKFQVGSRFQPCTPTTGYGFDTFSGPCVFLKFAQIPDKWIPEIYHLNNFSADMPEDLINNIQHFRMAQKVWISCEGENPADMENIGPVSYLPDLGFSVNHFFNSHLEGYLSPLVAVFFEHPARGVLINIQCTAWAKNLPRDPEKQLGTVHFELMVDY